MIFTFKNQHIYWALQNCFNSQVLGFAFANNIINLCKANPDDNYVQTIDIPEKIVPIIFSQITCQPEGEAAAINHAILISFNQQLSAASNLTAVQAGTAQPNEACRIQMAIQPLDQANTDRMNQKIQIGKQTILNAA